MCCPADRWSFGGGTVLMRRYRHRFSKDIDIFVPDPQYLGHLSPRLNDEVEAMTAQFNEQANFIKLYFPEGEIDIVAAGALTQPSSRMESVLGRVAMFCSRALMQTTQRCASSSHNWMFWSTGVPTMSVWIWSELP
jgi:hypothetical protein